MSNDYAHPDVLVSPDTTVVFYGDKNNWWATYAFWVFQLFGHTNVEIYA